jgi:broad specificity phosphatase PhoE
VLTPVPFYFLRHGETDWNRDRIIQGQTDTPLNATGLQQAEAVAVEVAKLSLRSICCSSLQRARSTAEIINRGLGKPIHVLLDLMECALGEIQGQPSNGAWRDPWVKGGPMPGGETYAQYTARVIRGFAEALPFPGPVLIVGHGGNFWALEDYGLIPEIRLPNCALFYLEPPRDSKYWNVTQLAAPEGRALAIGEAALA